MTIFKVINAAILAGGSAVRLGGVAKGNIKIKNDETIISTLICELKKSGIQNVIISANEEDNYKKYKLPIISDINKNCGPLAGIESSLMYYKNSSDAVLFLPCDLPNISACEISALVLHYLRSSFDVVFATTSSQMHPLCAIVNRLCLPKISEAVARGTKKIITVWQELDAFALEFASEESFVNINTPQDLENFSHE